MPVSHFAPATDVLPAKFDKVDRPFVFVIPRHLLDFPLILVDLHNRPRPDDGVHRAIRHSDKSIHAIAEIKMLNQPVGNLTPDLPEPSEKIGSVEPESLPRVRGYHDRVVQDGGPVREFRLGRYKHGLVPAKVAEVTPEKREHVRPVDVIDGPE